MTTPRQLSAGTLPIRIAATAVGLLVYRFLTYLSIPMLDGEALRSFMETALGSASELSRVSIVALGIIPFVTGFLLVELAALVFPPWRKLRRGGVEGRRRLNRLAVRVSFLVALAQALGIVLWLEKLTAPGGLPLVPEGGGFFRLVAGLSLLAGTALVLLIAQAISRWGLGNGFCVLLLAGVGEQAVQAWTAGNLATESSIGPFGEALLLLLAAILLVTFFIARRNLPLRLDEEELPFRLPAFPIGIVPLTWALSLPQLYWTFAALHRGAPSSPSLALGPILVLVPLLSWMTYHFFSSPRRLRASFHDRSGTPVAELPAVLTPLQQSAVVGAVALMVLGLLFQASSSLWGLYHLAALGAANLVMLVAFGLDLAEEIRFRRQHPETASLLELDNVHLASLLQAKLEARGIDSLLRSRHFRGLFFFLGPLYKMELEVPADRQEESLQIVDPEEWERV